MQCNPPVSLLLGYLAVYVAVRDAGAGEWPQILGPNRNGVAVDERIAASWPDGGPRVLWQRDVGSGFSGVSVSKGVAVLLHRVDDEEVVEGLNALNGEPLWKSSFAAAYVPSYTSDDGPRAPPVIAGERVFVYGAMGDLRCLDLKSGKTLWERNTYEEFNSKKYFRGEPPEGYFGLASSPIVEGDKIIANVGGDAQDAGIVAFSVDTGRTIWKATSERASYSSPVATTVDGKRHVIFVTRLNAISLDPDTGAERFRFPFGRIGPTVNAANPLVFDGHVFVTASYGIGSVLAKIGSDRAEIVWRDAEILASQYTTCVEHEGHLFGINGRQDGPPADLVCFDPKTREVTWTQPSFGCATLLKAGDKLLIVKTDGTLVLVAANIGEYEELEQSRICEKTIRALPALANGLLYVRDTRVLKCLDLRPGT
ncbi:MAG: PQQ-like beta-propeller repeat protein [Planctomycetes bacterium]|nr:PQQ-like beta-propeller repeat protein [Planctomycetota bacterium]MBL7042264.1 PQQ-like beta-propeller repeat protein [Pirellulaceae bacterium]